MWKNGGSDGDAVWHHRSDESKDEEVSGVWRSVHGPREGTLFGSNLGRTIVTNGDLYGVHVQQRRDAALFKITLGRLVWIVTVLMLAWSTHSSAWQSVSSAKTAKCPASTGTVAMNDLQETVWSSSSHLQHNGISWSFSVLHPS